MTCPGRLKIDNTTGCKVETRTHNHPRVPNLERLDFWKSTLDQKVVSEEGSLRELYEELELEYVL